MPFPQMNTALDVPWANFVKFTASTHTALAGDFLVFSGSANTTVTLPAASEGAIVAVENIVGTYTVTVKSVEGTNKIAGATGSTGYVVPAGGTGAGATKATFVSDGTDWHVV